MRRGIRRNSALAKPRSDDEYVTTAKAKRDWFLKPEHLDDIRATAKGGGAVFGAGRVATYYRVRDLDRLAARVHGPKGLEEKR